MYLEAVLLIALLGGVQAEGNMTSLDDLLNPKVENSTSDDVMRSEMSLRKHLLTNYEKTAMPSRNTRVTLIEVSIQNIEMHESAQIMEVLTRLSLLWDDPRLIWDLESHPDVGFLGMDPEAIWTPDLAVYNGASQTHVPRSSLPMVVYPSDGTILYTSPYNLEFSCVMDLTYWPHDSHHCTLKLGSWVHQGHMLDLFLKDNKVEIEIPVGLTSSGKNLSTVEWSITGTLVRREMAHYACCSEPLVTILMTIMIQRNAPVYAWTVKVPAVCLSFLTMILFLLPPTAGEKMGYGALCLFANMFYLSYTSNVIAQAPTHTPLIIRFVSQQVILVTISLLASACIVRLARDPRSKGLPFLIKKAIVVVSYPLCLRSYRNLITYTTHTFEYHTKSEQLDLENANLDDQHRGRHQLNLDGCEWLFLAAVLDRVALFVYVAICVISLIRFSYVL